MPIIKYCIFAGGLLLALMVGVNYYLPPPVEKPPMREVDKSAIRLYATPNAQPSLQVSSFAPTPAPALPVAAISANSEASRGTPDIMPTVASDEQVSAKINPKPRAELRRPTHTARVRSTSKRRFVRGHRSTTFAQLPHLTPWFGGPTFDQW
jgi:hypothetical protein